MLSIHRMLFLALKKVEIAKITPPQVLTTGWKNPPRKISDPPPYHYLENPALHKVEDEIFQNWL